MCDVCESYRKDYLFSNGDDHTHLAVHRFVQVYPSAPALVKLCYIHDIEYFMLGEKKFLMKHLAFLRALRDDPKKYQNRAS